MESIFIIGRILLGGYFIFSGVNHFTNIGMLTGYAKSKHLPAAKLAVALSGLILILGGLTILLNFWNILGLWALIVFLVVTTLVMHQFWTIKDPQARMGDMINFNKNIALIGALLLLIVK